MSQLMAEAIAAFRRVWPEAEHGPAHIVISDENCEIGHLAWCDGIIYAVQEERRLGGRLLYADHSDREIEATRRLLALLLQGHPETILTVSDAGDPEVTSRRWEDVPPDDE